MSELIVTVERVLEVKPHPNADRLDLVTVKGWQVIVGKDSSKAGDLVVYIPIDSILPNDFEAFLFPPESKIKLKNSRVRTIKIRGEISQGMVVSVASLSPQWGVPYREGADVKGILGIEKYEPPVKCPFTVRNGNERSKKETNPNFKKYTSLNHLKNYPDALAGMDIIITEKIHGTNFRAGYVKSVADTWWKKIKKFVGLLPEYEFVFGSHNVQLQNKMLNDTYFKKNVYAAIVDKYDLRGMLNPGEVVYGEIYGDGIQKGYNYSLKNQIDLAVFDVMVDGEYLSFSDAFWFSMDRYLSFVPILATMAFSEDSLEEYVSGKSTQSFDQSVREGIVVRPIKETQGQMGRLIFKYINPDFLMLKDNSEWH